MAKYTAIYTHGDDGWWTVRIKEVPGVHSQGRSISQAQSRIREALSLFVDDADDAAISNDIRLDANTRLAISKVEAEERLAARTSKRMAILKVQAARKLVAKMSVRDASVVLGVSHQRIQQLVKPPKASKPKSRRLSSAHEQVVSFRARS